MFTTIRHYRVKLGQADQAIRLTEVELVPVVSALPGFVAYQALLVGPQAMATISTYRDREAADSANSLAANWVENRLDSLVEPLVDVGQVRISMSGVSDNASAIAPAQPAADCHSQVFRQSKQIVAEIDFRYPAGSTTAGSGNTARPFQSSPTVSDAKIRNARAEEIGLVLTSTCPVRIAWQMASALGSASMSEYVVPS